MGAKPGSLIRKVVEKTAGISSVRMLPPFAKQRFTTWFKKRPQIRLTKSQGDVAVFPTCLVEYQDPRIGHDMVKVYEHKPAAVIQERPSCRPGLVMASVFCSALASNQRSMSWLRSARKSSTGRLAGW